MTRRAGYLASLDNIPPLIFRFQFNPEILTEKKSFKYREDQLGMGEWGFDQYGAATGFVASALGLWRDVKEWGSLLTATKPMNSVEGAPRQFELEFKLDASVPGPMDGSLGSDSHYDGSIEPDLAILRSFMNPSLSLFDLPDVFKGNVCWERPPECALKYGDISINCVMTDLSIKVTDFQENGKPLRAEVSTTLKEQSFSAATIVDFATRYYNVGRSYDRKGIGRDFVEVSPMPSFLIDKMFD